MASSLLPSPLRLLHPSPSLGKPKLSPRRCSTKYPTAIRAVQQGKGGPRRLVDIIRIIPRGLAELLQVPLQASPFDALGVNDVIAAVVCMLLTEYVTRFYYSLEKFTFPIALLNNFKMGFTYGFFIDAFKLAS